MENWIYNLEIDKDLPIEIRGKYVVNLSNFNFFKEKVERIVKGFFILSTCNRVSIYFTPTPENPDTEKLELINKVKKIVFPTIEPKFRKDIEAVKHFFSIACGLESQIFAETDIIHQIKKSYKNQKDNLDNILEEMINYSFTVHKEFHNSILFQLKRKKQNLANTIYNFIKSYPQETPIILIGYGLANKSIHKKIKNYFPKIFIFSDSHTQAFPKNKLNHFFMELKSPCIIISATNTQLPELHPPKNSLIFDLSVPRSITLSNKSYQIIDLDTLKQTENLEENFTDDQKIIHNFLNRKTLEFINKIIINNFRSQIKEFYNIPLTIAEEKINQYFPEIVKTFQKNNEEEIRDLLKYVSQKIVNKSLEKPIEKIKELYILNSKKKIIVGTRGSKLALSQTHEIIELLKLYFPQFEFIIKIIKTSGDKGIYTNNSFTKELEEALIKEEIDLAIHSLKDIPHKINEYLEIAAIPIRIEPNDVLISKENKTFWELKPNSVIGTSSPRRKKQIQLLRKDLIVKDLRGNLDTRIKKLKENEYDAIVVAMAGIKRLNLEHFVSYIFSLEEMVPSPGQGALAIQTRKKSFLTDTLKKIDNPKYRKEIETEREFMKLLDLGCSSPIGACAQYTNNNLTFYYFVNIQNQIFKEKLINPDIKEIVKKIVENQSLNSLTQSSKQKT